VSSEPFSREQLRSAAADCSLWHYCRFEAASAALAAKVAAHADAPSPERLEAARAAWRSAMDEWSVIELFQFGPLASRSMSAGKDAYQGQGLRERIYSWPNLARCRVEEQIVLPTYDTQGFASVPLTGRGLFGLETLLFYPGSDTACVPASAAAKTWAALDSSELAKQKLAYARALAANIHAEMSDLIALFEPETGNYRELLVSASGYPSEPEALNTLAWALIYVEREVKDWKLGIPAGYTLVHPVSGPEAPFAGTGSENIRANLRGFQGLFQGCGAHGEGIGFDDWLSEAGHAELAADIVAAFGVARDAADAAGPLAGLSSAELETFYRAVKGLTDLIKGDLFGPASPLNLELPEGVEGDTD
jgi:predicted lipoprotein